MKVYATLAILLTICSLGYSYSKYGRSCKDIGCRSTEVCVMESDPCSYRSRQGECGSYPTCKKTGTQSTCATYICPPTKVCKMDGGAPKCVDDHSKSGHVGYNTQAVQSSSGSQSGSSSGSSEGSLYPSVPQQQPQQPHQPQQPQQPAGNRPAYQGGYQQPGAYPGYPGYQQPGSYPGYPQGGYSGYPGYQQPQGQYPGYNQGYNPNYNPGYNPYGGQPQQPQKNSGSSFLSDTLTESLKSIGTDLLKNAFNKILRQQLSGGGAANGGGAQH